MSWAFFHPELHVAKEDDFLGCELWLNLRLLFGLCCFSLAEIAVFQFFEHFPCLISFEHFLRDGLPRVLSKG